MAHAKALARVSVVEAEVGGIRTQAAVAVAGLGEGSAAAEERAQGARGR